jgi:hypothetical protein
MDEIIEGPTCEKAVSEIRETSIMNKLLRKREKAVAELTELDATIKLFKQHPEFEQCLTQLARCGIYR